MSGTSVGALNIAILLHGARSAEALWRSLSASQLMSANVIALPAVALFGWRWLRSQNYPTGLLVCIYIVGILVAFVIAAGLGLLLIRFFELATRGSPSWAVWLALLMVIAVTLLNIANGVFVFRPLIWEDSPVPVINGLFRTHKLEKLTSNLVPPGLFANASVRCFATVTREVKIIDPGELREVHVASFKPHWAYVARYIDLTRVERDPDLGTPCVRRTLSITSALPYIFSGVRLDRRRMFDGGLADNIPIGPLVAQCRCHRIFVLHLNQGNGLKFFDADSLWARLWRFDRLQRLEQVNDSTKGEGKTVEKIREQVLALRHSWLASDSVLHDQIRHCEIVHLFPSEHLGNFATGTLNFTGKKASWFISLGEADMRHLLDKVST